MLIIYMEDLTREGKKVVESQSTTYKVLPFAKARNTS